MNKIIEEQLSKCKIAKIPEHDETTVKLVIPKLLNSVEVSRYERERETENDIKRKV